MYYMYLIISHEQVSMDSFHFMDFLFKLSHNFMLLYDL